MKIIDWQKKGNVVRYILGHIDLEDWTGDDWNDPHWPLNAERVRSNFVASEIDIAYPFAWEVLEPPSEFTKDYMKDRGIPILILAGPDALHCVGSVPDLWSALATYDLRQADLKWQRIYMGDPASVLTYGMRI